jgi:hypothetical protein
MRHYAVTVAAVRDRIVQAAVKIVLEPVFEADFLPCSFGLAQVQRAITRSGRDRRGPDLCAATRR